MEEVVHEVANWEEKNTSVFVAMVTTEKMAPLFQHCLAWDERGEEGKCMSLTRFFLTVAEVIGMMVRWMAKRVDLAQFVGGREGKWLGWIHRPVLAGTSQVIWGE